jgi:hypothetical protein
MKGKFVYFDDCHLHVELEDERIISTPISWHKELRNASLFQIKKYTFICQGTGIEWPDLDYHISIESMLFPRTQEKAV